MIENHVFFHFWQENLNPDCSIDPKSEGLKIVKCVFYCFSCFFHVFSWNFHDFSPLKNKSRCILLRFFQFWEFLNKSENFWTVFSLKFHEISTFFKSGTAKSQIPKTHSHYARRTVLEPKHTFWQIFMKIHSFWKNVKKIIRWNDPNILHRWLKMLSEV